MMRQFNLEFLRRATDLATESVTSERGGSFAALIARDGKIVAEGMNMVHGDEGSDGASRGDGHPAGIVGGANGQEQGT